MIRTTVETGKMGKELIPFIEDAKNWNIKLFLGGVVKELIVDK